MESPVTVSSKILAHRTVPGVLVQDVRVHNPTSALVQLSLERLGIANWETAKSLTRTLEHGEGGVKYSIVTGVVGSSGRKVVVAVAAKKLPSSLEVKARMTERLHLLTGVAYSAPLEDGQSEGEVRQAMERQAVQSVAAAAALTWQRLHDSHTEVR